ncbi:MAG: MFS transporter [Chthoniobacterales bacterium]
MPKPPLSFWQIWNMSFGFLGIQFGWGLQMANMSAIYTFLGAKPEQLSLLWIAAPLTGLIVQPIVGYLSDRTWNRLGRRRPYFLVGALIASAALIAMPNSSVLWMAVGLLWILDASINVTMEPFRAFVADKLPEEQRKQGFAMQSLFIGLGAVIASALPWILSSNFGMSMEAAEGHIPAAIKLAFYIGAGAFLFAVLVTILTTPEYPPEDLDAFLREKEETRGLWRGVQAIFAGIATMPPVMRQLAAVQFFTWLGLFAMWIYFSVSVGVHFYGGLADGTDEQRKLFSQGVAWAGLCFAAYNGVCFIFSFVIMGLARRYSAKAIHILCLLCGAAGLGSVMLFTDPKLLLLSMTGVGIAWASILSMPYAMLSGALDPKKMGLFMGIFNFFIVIPQVVASLGLGLFVKQFLGNDPVGAVAFGGLCFLLAALLTFRVQADEDAATAKPVTL